MEKRFKTIGIVGGLGPWAEVEIIDPLVVAARKCLKEAGVAIL